MRKLPCSGFAGTKACQPTLFQTTEALPIEARHETRAVVVFPGITAAFSATTSYPIGEQIHSCMANLEGAIALETAIPSSLNCIPSTQLAVLQADQHEVHAVVVDMPQRASLEFASPDTWGALPTSDPPDEESPTKSVLQVALN